MSETQNQELAVHPTVAALAAQLQEDQTGLYLPESAIDQAREELGTGDEEALIHLCAWLAQVCDAAPDACFAVQRSVLGLLVDALGSEQAAADLFDRVGAGDGANLLGGATAKRAPRASAPTPSALHGRAVRGIPRKPYA